ncbi:MAG: ABC transporter permease [Rikenellaceae bacterium]
MKQFLVFVRKEFCHIFRDVRTVMILLLMPIVQIILFGFALSSEVNNVNIAIFDPAKDHATQLISERISASQYFNVVKMISNPAEIESLFKSGKVNVVLVYSERFYENILHTGDAQIQLITDGTDPNTANAVTRYATAIIMTCQLILRPAISPKINIVPEVRMLYNPQMKSSYNFVPGVMGLILMLICAMMTSISIVREKEVGTMEVLLVSPMKPIYIIIAKAVPYFVLSIVNLATILLLAVFVLGVPISGSLFWLIFISLIFILVALSIGLLISTLVDTQVAAMLISGMVFMMPTMILSGLIYPVENMPWILRFITNFIPAKWYIVAVKKLMIQGLSIDSVFFELIVLSSMAIIFMFISLKMFKKRLA